MKVAKRTTLFYLKGQIAFNAGWNVSLCPYRKGHPRKEWLVGWYDARTQWRLGHIFEKWEIDYP